MAAGEPRHLERVTAFRFSMPRCIFQAPRLNFPRLSQATLETLRVQNPRRRRRCREAARLLRATAMILFVLPPTQNPKTCVRLSLHEVAPIRHFRLNGCYATHSAQTMPSLRLLQATENVVAPRAFFVGFQEEEGPRSSCKEQHDATLVSWPPQVPRQLSHSLTTRAGKCRYLQRGKPKSTPAVHE